MEPESSRAGYQITIDNKRLGISLSEAPDRWLFSEAETLPAAGTYSTVHFYRPFVIQPTELKVPQHPGFDQMPVKHLLEPSLYIEFLSNAETSKHLAEPFYKLSKSRASGFNSYASVLVYDGHCIIFHFLNNKLNLANSFPGRNPEEILYFILAAPVQALGDPALTRFEVLAPPSLLPGISEVFSRHLPNTGNMTLDNSIDVAEADSEYAPLAWLLKYLAVCE